MIRWSYNNPKTGAPFVVTGRKQPAFSSATLPLEELDSGMVHYEDADWFPQIEWGKDGVHEETKRMPKLNSGLTLLWLPSRQTCDTFELSKPYSFPHPCSMGAPDDMTLRWC